MLSESWQVGYELTPDEVEALYSLTEPVEILAVTTHPTPGGHYDGPHPGDRLLLVNDSWLFSSIPDEENDEVVSYYFLGRDHSLEELAETASAFLVEGDHEVAAAVGFYFDEKKISAWNDDFAKAIDQLYWFRSEHEKTNFNAQLKELMHQKSSIFSEVANLLSDPQNAEYSELKHRILNDWSFEYIYRKHKYQQ